MLTNNNIFAVSPYIGSSSIYTQTYFIKSKSDLVEMLSYNYEWIMYTVQSVLPLLSLQIGTESSNKTTYQV